MSTSSSGVSINSSGGLTTNSTLTNSLGTLQESGLASGVDSTAIIQAELAIKEEPMNNLEDEITGIKTEDTQLSQIESYLQTVASDAQSLSQYSLYDNVQSVSSTNSSLVSATATSSIGAVVGSSTITVSQLASAASRTFTYTSPSTATTIEIDGKSVNLSAGESAASLASSINSSNSLDVYAATTTDSSGNTELVLSDRTTGVQSGDYIDVSGASGVLTENTSLASAGADAEYSINGGTTQSSSTDTVTNAIAGISLTLSGVTGSSPVTITANTPSLDSDSIISAVEQFVSDYNTALYLIESDINTAPSSETTASDYNPNSGSLFGDDELESLLNDLRESLTSSYGSGSSTYATLASIGVSTGTSTGSSSTDSTDGYLSVDTSKLTSAIEADPSSVSSLLTSWSRSFEATVNQAAQSTTGALAQRISGNTDLIGNLQDQYNSMQTLYNEEEQAMVEQWAKVESALEDLSAEKSSITTYTNEMEANNSSS